MQGSSNGAGGYPSVHNGQVASSKYQRHINHNRFSEYLII